jgi:hypothetical protein
MEMVRAQPGHSNIETQSEDAGHPSYGEHQCQS